MQADMEHMLPGLQQGNGRASRGENRGVAYESQLLIVKLGGRTQRDFPADGRTDAGN